MKSFLDWCIWLESGWYIQVDSVFKAVGKILTQVANVTFTLGGYKISVGAVILWAILAGAVIAFLRGLSD